MALPPVSVGKLKDGLFQIFIHTDSNSQNLPSSFNGTTEIKMTSLFGGEEYYKIECSLVKNGTHNLKHPYLKLTLTERTEKTIELVQRKVIARFMGYEKKMLFTSSSSTEWCPSWTAQWPEITRIGCSNCNIRKGMAEFFEILVDMDPTNILLQGQLNVLGHLSCLWETKILADVTFRFEERNIKAHSHIIASGSPVLAAMFNNDFKESQERIVTIKEVKADVFDKLLNYLHTGHFDLEFKDIAALLVAADMYSVFPLREACIKYLSRNVTLEQATNYLILSHLRDSEELFLATLKFIQQNSEAISNRPDWMSLIKNYPELSFIAVQFMVKKNTSNIALLLRMRRIRDSVKN